MSVDSISAASLSQYVLSTSDSNPLIQAMDTLQNSLGLGDLKGAQAAFQTVENLNQSLETAVGSSSTNSSQLSTDLTTLGSALGSGNLSAAESAFTTVQSDMKNSTPPSETNEANAATQSELLVQELLSTVSMSNASSNASDTTTSVLVAVYGNHNNLNIFG
jgi:hypothetical protein